MGQDVQQINFALNSYKARSSLASSERVLGMYAEQNPAESPFAVSLYNIPGKTQWLNLLNANPLYGAIVFGEFLYVVLGLDVYKIGLTKTYTFIGSMATTPGFVMMTKNTTQVTILTESGISYFIESDVLTQITDEDYQLANSVTTLDNYSVFTVKDSEEWFISAQGDTSTYSALDIAFAQANPDSLVVCLNYNRNLILMGTDSTEVWYDTGNLTFPFQRVDGVLIQKGCAAKYSAVVDITGYYWLGNDKIIYYSSAFAPIRISTFAIELAIEGYSVIDDAIAYIYTQAGHKFYVLNFPTEGKTWVYDISTGLWAERTSLNQVTFREEVYSATIHAYFDGQHIVNGAQNGILYELDLDAYDEDGIPLISEIISAVQFKDFKRFTVDKLVLMMDTGVGLISGQGSDPKLMITISFDGGKTWSKEIQGSLGEIGRYGTEIYWSNIGLGRSIIFKIRISDPVKRSFLGGYLNITEALS